VVTFERMLFDYNEFMHHSGRLAEGAYIDTTDLLIRWFVILILSVLYFYYVFPVVVDKLINTRVSEQKAIYIVVGMLVVFFTYLYLEHQYGLALCLMIALGFIYIIFTDKRLSKVREFIEKFF